MQGMFPKELIENPLNCCLQRRCWGNNPGDAFYIGTIDTVGKQRALIQAGRCLFFKGLLKNSFETAKAFDLPWDSVYSFALAGGRYISRLAYE
ncbi:hypothetical protein CEXT_404051 [Caerostris extrusa]|uniref:Uncharacterized protein n=1 Tax=Caerostris extrusa TaxID=172846 RepID=A0AAV4WV85_CAEEX|nr:hypothetical protein CEXT_404051 [Caerostris extrusa]